MTAALFFLLAIPVDAAASQPAIPAMTLPEAVAFARAHRPAIAAALARIEGAKADARVPRAQWQPSLSATLQIFEGTTNNSTAQYLAAGVDLPRIGSTRVSNDPSWIPHASTLAGFSLAQEVFDFGRIAAQAAVQDALLDVVKQHADDQRLEIELNVEETYFAVAAAHAILLASQQAYERTKIHSDMIEAGVKRGLRPPVELTRAEADLLRFDVGRIRAYGGLEIAQTALSATVGYPGPRLDTSGEPPEPKTLPSLASALQAAEKRDPALGEARARAAAQKALTNALAALWRPNLALTGTISTREGGAPPSSGDRPRFEGFIPDIPNWDVGLLVRWPLFDPLVWAQRDASAARETALNADLAEAAERLAEAVERAYVSVEVALSSLPALGRSVEAARANYAQVDARFRAGLATSVELADAEALRTDADIELARGHFELARARAALARLIVEEP